MADLPTGPDAKEGSPVRSDSEAAPRTPRWVIILGIVALILILAVVAQLVLGIQHGPGMHGS
jgi:hypothetical protein